jgi:hypothetical protein
LNGMNWWAVYARMNPVSCGIAMRSWLSRMSRSSVEPEPCAPTMKIGPEFANWAASLVTATAR